MKQLDHSARWVMALAVFALLLAGLYLALHLTVPSDGARLDYGDLPAFWTPEGVALAPIEPQANSLRRNDIVLAVDGQSTQDLARALLDPARARPRFEAGQTVMYTVRRGGQVMDVPVTLGAFPLGAQLAREWLNLVFSLPALALAGLVLARRPDERAAQVFCLTVACLVSVGLMQAFGIGVGDMARVSSFWVGRLAAYTVSYLMMGATLHFALIFPRPHPRIARQRVIVPLVYAAPFVGLIVYLAARWQTTANVLEWFGQWSVASDRINMIYLVLTIAALLVNYYAVRADAVMRQQARWVVLGYGSALALALALALAPKIIAGHWLLERSQSSLFLLPIPVCMAIAILRYHLFDIDFYLNRALVHGALTVFVIGAYSAIVGLLSALLRVQFDLALSLVATGLIAVVFQPVRERVQRAVNRLMYGERDEPYAVISRLGQQLEVTLSPDAVLPTIVETVARALKLPYAAIALEQGEEMVVAAEYGKLPVAPSASPRANLSPRPLARVTLSLTYQGETVGELRLAPRAPDESFSPGDRRLLDDLARQAGIAVHAVRLTTDLQRARQQLVNAREEERRRIRRDLHDGLGPALASLTFKLDAARNLLRRDADRADDLLAAVTDQTQEAIADIRRLVYDLRPPALDELGLVSALCEQVTQNQSYGIQIVFDAPERLPPLPAAVEVAAYRIVQEALTNVVRHSDARRCVVRLTLEGHTLCLEVHDDGQGLAAERHSGVGLHAMRERAAELGGTCVVESGSNLATRVRVRLPLPRATEGN